VTTPVEMCSGKFLAEPDNRLYTPGVCDPLCLPYRPFRGFCVPGMVDSGVRRDGVYL